MRKVALRGLLAHKVRLIATFLAVALGVAFIGGVLTLTDTMNRSFDDLFADVYESTDAVVRSDRTIGGGFEEGETRASVDTALLDRVRQVDSVAVAEGGVGGFARIIDRDGDPLGNPGFGAPTLGASWSDSDALNPFTLREGHGPRSDGEIVIDAASARSTGYRLGDRVPVQTKEGVEEFELVGIAGFGSVDSPAGSSYVLFTTAEAQQQLGEPGKFNDISVVAADGVSQRAVVADIEAAVGTDGVEALTGRQITEESQSDLRSELSFVTSFFLAFAIVAVIVGSFVIYNSFSIIVAQRTREMALLRAIGASRRQVRRAVLVEAVVVGLIASAAGFVLGLGIASLLTGLLDVDGSLAVVPTSVAIAVACGLIVTVVSALIPARRAAKVPPVAAMREVAIDRSGRSRVRFALGLLLSGVGAATVVSGATGHEVALVGLGVAAAFAGLLFAGPGLAQPISRSVGWPLSRLRGVTGVLARENAGRNPRRSASTAQALMIGVGIVAFFMVINTSIRASIDKTLDDSFNGDFIVDSGTFGQVGLPHELATQIAELPEVSAVAPLRYAPVEVDGDSTSVTGTTTAGFDIFGLDLVEGSDVLGHDEVVVLHETATEHDLAVGDTLDLDFLDTGRAPLTVAGIYDGPESNNLGDYVIGLDEMARRVPDDSDSQITLELADGVTVEQARPVLEGITDSYVSAEVQSVDDFKESLGSQLDVFLNLVLGLLALAIVIAGLGIANTIALSVLERTRELGLLRAVGMTRRQLRATIRWESVIIALFGTILGLAVGVLGGWGMVTAFEDEGFEVFQVPYGTIAMVGVLAAGLGLLAALLPAWRASRLNVLAAIHTE
jgi:putative ABC transport system permease protein